MSLSSNNINANLNKPFTFRQELQVGKFKSESNLNFASHVLSSSSGSGYNGKKSLRIEEEKEESSDELVLGSNSSDGFKIISKLEYPNWSRCDNSLRL